MLKKITRAYKKFILRDPTIINHADWVRDNAELLRTSYPLNSDSIYFDLGAHNGSFADKIISKFDCHAFLFEPQKDLADMLMEKYASNPKVQVFPYGLSGGDHVATISSDDTGASVYKKGNTQILLRDILKFCEENEIANIDLMKINIEGGEYDVLSRLIVADKLGLVNYYQIQFHTFVKGAAVKRSSIQQFLDKTHTVMWNYPFVWESWKRRAS